MILSLNCLFVCHPPTHTCTHTHTSIHLHIHAHKQFHMPYIMSFFILFYIKKFTLKKMYRNICFSFKRRFLWYNFLTLFFIKYQWITIGSSLILTRIQEWKTLGNQLWTFNITIIFDIVYWWNCIMTEMIFLIIDFMIPPLLFLFHHLNVTSFRFESWIKPSIYIYVIGTYEQSIEILFPSMGMSSNYFIGIHKSIT